MSLSRNGTALKLRNSGTCGEVTKTKFLVKNKTQPSLFSWILIYYTLHHNTTLHHTALHNDTLPRSQNKSQLSCYAL